MNEQMNEQHFVCFMNPVQGTQSGVRDWQFATFKCPECGTMRRQNLASLGQRRLTCDGIRTYVVRKVELAS